MNRIVISDSGQFQEVISSFEQSLTKLKDIFANELNNAEKINSTSTWTSDAQKVIYGKYRMLANNFGPIEDSIQLYINFMKKTLNDYMRIEEHIERSAIENSVQLDVNS